MRLFGLVTSFFGLALFGPLNADDRHLEFVEKLQERGLHDLAVEYIRRVRTNPESAATVAPVADYYIARSLLAGADSVTDLEKRDEQLKQARSHFRQFIQQNPQHDRAPDAQMGQAQILIQQGRIALLRADNPANAGTRVEIRRQARQLYEEARDSFNQARDRFRVEWKKFPPSIPEDQKRLRDAKTLAQVRIMQAHLFMGEAEHEIAQTHEPGSPPYRDSLNRAIGIFEEVRQQFRDRLGGQYARMWQGKCYEELGELGKAEGIYKELVEQEIRDSSMQELQRHVQFFQIIVLNKRGDHVLAADLARQWIQENARAGQSEIRMGVQFEHARALLQQAENSSLKAGERNRFVTQALEILTNVARYDNIYKQPAIALQQKYKAMIGSGNALVTFDQALAMADLAKDRNAWPEAADLYAKALKLAKDDLEADSLAFLRYKLGFAHFQIKKYYEAAVLGEYVARRQPASQYAAPAAHLALESYARSFDALTRSNRETDFEQRQIVQLAEYMAKEWPTRPEANHARMLLGDLHLQFERLEAAGEAFESVSPGSADRALALARAGAAFWRLYVDSATSTNSLDTSELAKTLERARANMDLSIAEYRKQVKKDAPVPLEMADTAIQYAESCIEAGQGDRAVNLMREFVPLCQAQNNLKPLELRALIVLLRACINVKNLEAAEDAMRTIEQTGKDVAQITRVYLDLGKQLQSEMSRLKALGDQGKYESTRASYVAFLNQMSARREGQTFLTLQWTGEAFFGLEMYEQAGERFSQIVRKTIADPTFLDQTRPELRAALVQSKIRYVTALRKLGRFTEAWDQIRPLPPESNAAKDPLHVGPTTNLDIIMERGFVLEDWGGTNPAKLKIAIDHWVYWGQQLEKLTPRPAQYWEIRLHLLRSLLTRARHTNDPRERELSLKQAEQQILVLTKTSASLGGPSYKSQFKAVQQELERELKQRSTPSAQSKNTLK